MPGVSYDQLMTVPQIMRLVKKLHTPSSFFQDFLGLGVGSPANISTDLRTAGYDIYSATRTLAPATAPGAPPPRVGRKPIGTAVVTLLRLHAAISIYDEHVFQSRPWGGRVGTVDAAGQQYVAQQVKHLTQMFINSREFMVSRMLQGGFGLKAGGGDQFRLCEVGDGSVLMTNDYQIPAINKGDLDGIIASGEGWDQAGAPIHDHLLTLSERMARTSGYAPRHIIMNGTTAIPLFTNTKLAAIRGTSNVIFDSITNRQIGPEEAQTSAYYKIVFGAIPQFIFHIYNAGLCLDEIVPNETEQIASGNYTKMIPDGYACILPEKGDWAGYMTGREPVRETVAAPLTYSSGFKLWRTPEIDPARYDIKALDNGVPVLFNPQCVNYANVWRTGL